MSDETIEQMLSARQAPEQASALDAFCSALRDAGDQPPSEPTAAAHLSAMISESRRVREGAIEHAAQPASPRRMHAVPKRITASAAASTACIALVIAGALPGPVQAAASDVLAVVGISVPDGDSERSDAGRDHKQRNAEPPGSPRTALPAVEPDGEQPRQATGEGAVDGQAEGDRDRTGSDRRGDEPERDGEDEGRRGSDEESRDAEPQREPSDDDDDDDGRGGSGPGAEPDQDRPADKSGTGGADRSETSRGSPPDSGDEKVDVPED